MKGKLKNAEHGAAVDSSTSFRDGRVMRTYLLASEAGVERGLCLMKIHSWLTFAGMPNFSTSTSSHSLKILPA